MAGRIENEITLTPEDVKRVNALRRYKLLEAATEDSFNNIAELMADVFEMPIALVSLVDEDEVFFKGKAGMPGMDSAKRDISLCSFAILSSQPTIFDKPLEEPCLLANPLVHGAFGLRFYAAAPLITHDGFAIGSVCVIDKKERSFSAQQQQMLVRFARMVMDQIELRLAAIEKLDAQRKLNQQDKEFRKLIHQAPVPIFIFRGEEMIIDTANKKALQMIRRSEDAVGKPLLQAVPELTGSPAYEVFQNVYRTGEAQYGLEMLVPLEKDGVIEERYFNFAYTPLFEDGTVVGIMDVATEVTEQVRARMEVEKLVTHRTRELADANKAMQASNEELQRSNAQLEEFAHAASHDLKEPIRKIHFFTEQLKGQLENRLTESESRSFTRIENATRHMGNLIDDLLLYSHVSQRPHEKEPVDLHRSISRVLEDLEVDIAEKAAVIQMTQLPVVLGYPRQLQQLFQNLFSNALKYCKAEVPPVINVVSRKEKVNGLLYDVIRIEDNGIGFDEQYSNKIFQMFFRLHGKSEYQGTGVGLSIVKKVVENHDGFVKVESMPDNGSTFSVHLPAGV